MCRASLPRFEERLSLGARGIRVSPICLGMVDSPQTIAAAFDAGINFFFVTADMHWPYYEASRRGLEKLFARGRRVRSQVVVAAASYVTQPEFCTLPFLEVIDSVEGLERIDVAIMGGVYGSDFASRQPLYAEHRRIGHAGIRAIGATFHERKAAPAAITRGLVDIAFARYNPAHPGARRDLFPALRRGKRAPLYNFKSAAAFVRPKRLDALGIGKANWRPRVTDHYRFALTRPEIDGLLCALRTPREVAALQRALEAGPLDEEEESYLLDLAALTAGGRIRTRSGRT
jgi:hypothetical protein